MKPLSLDAPPAPKADVLVRRGFDPVALEALFVLTLREHLRGRRLLILSLLFLLPSVLALLTRLSKFPPSPENLEFGLIFNFIPHALATLTALLYAAGIIQDEVEEQTLTYLLLRPLPRWALYVTKLLATLVVTVGLTGVFTLLAYVVIYWGTPQLWDEVLLERVPRMVALLALAQVGYCAIFGALGLVTRRALLAGLAYIIAFEGLLASLDIMARQMTVMYYFRVLVARWLPLPQGQPGSIDVTKAWFLDLEKAPSSEKCVQVVLGVSALAVVVAVMMMRREFRMKTPEGN